MSTSKKKSLRNIPFKQTEIPCLYLHSWLEAKIDQRRSYSKTIYTLHGLILLNSFQCTIFSNNSFLKQENEKKMEKYSQRQKGKTIQNLQAEKEKELERAH